MQQHRLIKAFWLALFFTLCNVSSVGAFPPLPSSFYGTVQQDGENVPNGTLVEALLEGRVIAYSLSETFHGDSVFSLDVPGDDTTSDKVEGGMPGDVIEFRVGGVFADQTARWTSGVNENLDLTLPANNGVSPTIASLTPAPSQTPIPSTTDNLTITQKPENNSADAEPTIEIVLTITPDSLPTYTENQTIEEDLPENGLRAMNEHRDSSDPILKGTFRGTSLTNDIEIASDAMAVGREIDQGRTEKNYAGLWIGLSLLLLTFLPLRLMAGRKKDGKENNSSLS